MTDRRVLARLRRFTRDRRGATAVEFALVATPFFLLMLAIFEFALLYLVSVTLDSAVTESARQVRTGEAQQAGVTAATFKTSVCNNMGWLQSECSNNLYVDARVFGSFAGESSPQPVSNGKFDPTQLQFAVGGPGNIVLITCFYQWKLLNPVLMAGLAKVGGNIDVITSRAAFRNEPYS